MAVVYRLVNDGAIESQDGSRRVYMLRQIAGVIVNAELERRIADLEERATVPPGRGLPAPERTLN